MIIRQRVLRYASISLATLGLGLGIAAADGGSINTTGPQSNNRVESVAHNNARITNDNRVGVNNNNDQNGASGSAVVANNTTAGGAASGDVYNANSATTSVSVANGQGNGALNGFFAGSGAGNATGSITLTGPNSNNVVTSHQQNSLQIDNDNCVTVQNNNTQSGYSGAATVTGNTVGGSAQTGSVTNTNTATSTVTISN